MLQVGLIFSTLSRLGSFPGPSLTARLSLYKFVHDHSSFQNRDTTVNTQYKFICVKYFSGTTVGLPLVTTQLKSALTAARRVDSRKDGRNIGWMFLDVALGPADEVGAAYTRAFVGLPRAAVFTVT